MIKSSGHRVLDNSALDAVRKWKFHPATIGGVKVSSTVKVPVRFRLEREDDPSELDVKLPRTLKGAPGKT
jgi:hypothetical protein